MGVVGGVVAQTCYLDLCNVNKMYSISLSVQHILQCTKPISLEISMICSGLLSWHLGEVWYMRRFGTENLKEFHPVRPFLRLFAGRCLAWGRYGKIDQFTKQVILTSQIFTDLGWLGVTTTQLLHIVAFESCLLSSCEEESVNEPQKYNWFLDQVYTQPRPGRQSKQVKHDNNHFLMLMFGLVNQVLQSNS